MLLYYYMETLTSIPLLSFLKDAIDLLQGHYILSVSRSMTPTAEKGGVEAFAVSKSNN